MWSLEIGDGCFRLGELGVHIEDDRLVRRVRLRVVLLWLLWKVEKTELEMGKGLEERVSQVKTRENTD